jgi:hypothetical protein
MAVDLRSGDQQRVMKAMSGMTGLAMGQQRYGSQGDLALDRMDSIPEAGDDPLQPVAPRRAAPRRAAPDLSAFLRSPLQARRGRPLKERWHPDELRFNFERFARDPEALSQALEQSGSRTRRRLAGHESGALLVAQPNDLGYNTAVAGTSANTCDRNSLVRETLVCMTEAIGLRPTSS